MAKRSKQQSAMKPQAATSHVTGGAVHPPAKEPTLLAVSIILFALWFVFLLVAAIFG